MKIMTPNELVARADRDRKQAMALARKATAMHEHAERLEHVANAKEDRACRLMDRYFEAVRRCA